MAKGIKKEEHRPEKPAFKEKVSVKYDNGDFRGWKTLAKWAHLIGIELPKEQRGKESMVVIKFDDGEHITAEERGGGWIKDEDGDLHRMRKLGFETVLEKEKEGCLVCDECGSTFDTKKGLKSHQTIAGACRSADSMSTTELVRLRRTRQTSASVRGKTERKVEIVSVTTCENLTCKPTGSFVYLGSLLDMTASATPEIKRRIGMAFTTFGKLNNVWKSKNISRDTKAALYKSLILTIMLYNAEVWPVKKQDIKALEGAHFRMLRRLVITDNDNKRIGEKQLHKVIKMPSVEDFHKKTNGMDWTRDS